MAWNLYDTWCKHELADRATPFDANLLLSLAGYAICRLGDLALGVALLIGFLCMLRVCEILLLCKADVTVVASTIVLSLGSTKGGKRRGDVEQVLVTDGGIMALLKLRLQDLAPGDRLPPLTYHQFLRKLMVLLAFFGLSGEGYRLYSLRRGGATHDFRSHGVISKTSERGRWSYVKTGSLYVADATTLIAALQRSEASAAKVFFWKNISDKLLCWCLYGSTACDRRMAREVREVLRGGS